MATRLEKTITILFAGVVACGIGMCGWIPAGIAFACNGLLGWAMGEVNATPADDRLAARGGEAGLMKPEAQGFGNDLLREASNQDELTFHGPINITEAQRNHG